MDLYARAFDDPARLGSDHTRSWGAKGLVGERTRYDEDKSRSGASRRGKQSWAIEMVPVLMEQSTISESASAASSIGACHARASFCVR